MALLVGFKGISMIFINQNQQTNKRGGRLVMNNKKNKIMFVGIFMLVLMVPIAMVDGQERVQSGQEWKLTVQQIYGPTSRSTPMVWALIDEIEKETRGRVTFPKRFDSSALVPVARALPALAEGTFHFFHTTSLFHAGVDPVFAFLEVPGLASTREMREKILNDPDILGIMQRAWNRQGIQLIGFQCIAEQVWTFKKKVKNIDDMKGLRIVGSGGVYDDLVKALGASTVLIPPAERYEAMMRGVGDGLASTIYMLEDYKLGETVVQIMLPPWIAYQTNPWLASKKTWDSFPEDIKAIITRAAGAHLKKTMDIYEEDYVKKANPQIIKKYNLDVLQLSKDDLGKVHKASEVVMEKYAARSSEAKQLVDIWRAKYIPKKF
jgi:TRAP-type C4-dicarboxylate transport system substrate-binding protein